MSSCLNSVQGDYCSLKHPELQWWHDAFVSTPKCLLTLFVSTCESTSSTRCRPSETRSLFEYFTVCDINEILFSQKLKIQQLLTRWVEKDVATFAVPLFGGKANATCRTNASSVGDNHHGEHGLCWLGCACRKFQSPLEAAIAVESG